MDKENRDTLREISKGCLMGLYTVSYIKGKTNDSKLRNVLDSLNEEYDCVKENLDALYCTNFNGAPAHLGIMNRKMTRWGIDHNLDDENSSSKISEIIIQGLNMGIIEGRRILNNKCLNSNVTKLVNKFTLMQERYVEKLKNFL